MTITDYYKATARAFSLRLDSIFATEDSLKDTYSKHFPTTPFDRTARWRLIFRRELDETWKTAGPEAKTSMTDYDERQILFWLAHWMGFEIWSQVYCNLQAGNLSYRKPTDTELEALRSKWEGKTPSPYEKAKMFAVPVSQEEKEFNQDLSTLKAMRIITAMMSDRSFRVTPKGQTPALADAQNLSMLGVGGDRFLVLPPSLTAFYITWTETPNLLSLQEDGTFLHRCSVTHFTSKSGGEMLNSVLYSRLIHSRVYEHDQEIYKVALPRINSVLVVSAQPEAFQAELKADLNEYLHKLDDSRSDWVDVHAGPRSNEASADFPAPLRDTTGVTTSPIRRAI